MPKVSAQERLPKVTFPTIYLAPMLEMAVFAGCFESAEDALAQYEGVSSDRGAARRIKSLRASLDQGYKPEIEPFWTQHPLEPVLLVKLTSPFKDVFQYLLAQEKAWLHPDRLPKSHSARVYAARAILRVPEGSGHGDLDVLELLLQQVLFSYALYRAWRGCESGVRDYLAAPESSEVWRWKHDRAFIPFACDRDGLVGSVKQMLDFTVERLGHKSWKDYALGCELTSDARSEKSIRDKLKRWAGGRRPLKPKAFIDEFSLGSDNAFQAPPFGAIVFPAVIDLVCRFLAESGLPDQEIAARCGAYTQYVELIDHLLRGQGLGPNAQPQFV